ncbi:hypothetical protein CTEN210_08502 [Chaetoceros tenuissimus]|uniref:WW domain-containing protein n=1 Tax=Chaetoceros tenuissimus TaxID=426638 RepID=A0AAD3CVP6_9STRA|nr:hypothetical protein CTEN210_08502 [Chaetoceros tenuissimus]
MEHDVNEFFISVYLGNMDDVKAMLSVNHRLVAEKSDEGNALNIAACQGDYGMGRLLIEFDSPIVKNQEGLNPMGICKYRSNKEFFQLLSDHYEFDISERQYKRRNFESIISQERCRELKRQERIAKRIQHWQHRKKFEAATSIQSAVRKMLLENSRKRIVLLHYSATIIQKSWRWRFRDRIFRQRQRCARKIQSFQRMLVVRNKFIAFEYQRLWYYRALRILAVIIQRLWRGKKGRALARKQREMMYLPDPSLAVNFDWWLQCQKGRTWNAFSEYVLSGHPTSWKERNLVKRQSIYYRDVRFYVNNVTLKSSWEQPTIWKDLDERKQNERISLQKVGFTMKQDKASRKIQTFIRCRRSRHHFQSIMKVNFIMSNALEQYQMNPNNIIALCNYTFYVHAALCDEEKASTLYNLCLQRMASRDHPFILFNYSIFLAAQSLQYSSFLERAKEAEARRFAKKGRVKSSMVLADAFYRYYAINSNTANSWHNYALSRALVFTDFARASKAFHNSRFRTNPSLCYLKSLIELVHSHAASAIETYKAWSLEAIKWKNLHQHFHSRISSGSYLIQSIFNLLHVGKR